MQSSPRAARNSRVEGPKDLRIEGPKTAEVGEQPSGARGWFRGLIGRFVPEATRQKADTGANALLAFPSEVVVRAAPSADAGKIVTSKAARPSSTLIRPMLIVGIIVVLAGLSALAIQRFPLLRGTTK